MARACEPNKPWPRGSDGKHLFTSKTLRRWSRYGSGLQPYFQVRFHTQDVFLLGLTIASARTSLPVPDICQSPPMQVCLPQTHYTHLPILDSSKLGYRRGPSLIGYRVTDLDFPDRYVCAPCTPRPQPGTHGYTSEYTTVDHINQHSMPRALFLRRS